MPSFFRFYAVYGRNIYQADADSDWSYSCLLCTACFAHANDVPTIDVFTIDLSSKNTYLVDTRYTEKKNPVYSTCHILFIIIPDVVDYYSLPVFFLLSPSSLLSPHYRYHYRHYLLLVLWFIVIIITIIILTDNITELFFKLLFTILLFLLFEEL